MAPTSSDFNAELNNILASAQNNNLPYVDVRAGDLHQQVGGYPGADHRMPVCCDVMKKRVRSGDQILHKPPKGQGASLIIRYLLSGPLANGVYQP